MEAENELIPLVVQFELDDDGEVEITGVHYGASEINLTSLEEAALLSEIYDSVEFGEFAHD
jgi:electron transfer flavoprotein alpha/beta subunit